LSEKGKEQAQLLSKITPSFDVDAIICSPLTRTIQTANYAFEGQTKPYYINSNIREIYWSDYESRGHPDVLLRDSFKELDCFNLIDEESLLHCENGI
jgi:broad specificity phosphatase PhoE